VQTPELTDLDLMNMLDSQYTKTPFYGSRKMAKLFSLETGLEINRKRIQRLMRGMAITAIYTKPNTSRASKQNRIYPYLLTGVTLTKPNVVWSTDITYIRLKHGFAYLVAVVDWYSRKVLSWRLSNTMDSSFCVEALEEALERFGNPEYFNTDQGAQFTSEEFIAPLKSRGIKISMDGKGRAIDNIFTERLWRTIKYENVFIRGYESMVEARTGLMEYIDFYNDERIHASLSYRIPSDVYANARDVACITVGTYPLKKAA
jgi:putative transposase